MLLVLLRGHSRCAPACVVVLFLAVSCIFELLCVLAYAFVFPRLPIVKHYRARAASEGSLTVAADLAAAGITGPVRMNDMGHHVVLRS
jgi:hypothetical protein